jgi:hypothetical protein
MSLSVEMIWTARFGYAMSNLGPHDRAITITMALVFVLLVVLRFF